MWKRIQFLLAIIILSSALVACDSTEEKSPTGAVTGLKVTSPIQTCRMIDVPYEEQEAYLEREPYQATETYEQELKYEYSRPRASTTLNGFDVWATGDVSVRNVDSETGTFTVAQTFRTMKGSRTYTSSQYIMPGETKNFHAEHDIDSGDDVEVSAIVTPGLKTMTRTVTRYRDVTKYRTVTKYRQEQKCE